MTEGPETEKRAVVSHPLTAHLRTMVRRAVVSHPLTAHLRTMVRRAVVGSALTVAQCGPTTT